MKDLTKQQRKSVLAMIQLMGIINQLNGGEIGAYAICANAFEDRLHFSMDEWGCKQTPLLLKDKDTAMQCIDSHKQLWIDYLMLKEE